MVAVRTIGFVAPAAVSTADMACGMERLPRFLNRGQSSMCLDSVSPPSRIRAKPSKPEQAQTTLKAFVRPEADTLQDRMLLGN